MQDRKDRSQGCYDSALRCESRPDGIFGKDRTLDPGSGGKPAFVSVPYTFEEEAEPGVVYGFIADSKSGEMIGINVKKKGTSTYLRDAKDARQTLERELAPTAWVTVTEPTTLEITVWSQTPQPADYELFAYEWPLPKPEPSAATAP